MRAWTFLVHYQLHPRDSTSLGEQPLNLWYQQSTDHLLLKQICLFTKAISWPIALQY